MVSSHPLRELAVAVSLEGLESKSPTAARNLFVVHIDPKELLAEVVRNNFPVEWVARAVLNSQIYRSLIEVAPGLKEFYFLARLQALAERGQGAPEYDLLFWDAPATGHFLGTLHAARNFETFLSGPLASAGAELARFYSSASRISVLPTTTLEEMAIEETVEMCQKLKADFQLKASAVVMNLVSPIATAAESDAGALEREAKASSDPALRFAFDRGMRERARAKELRERLAAPAFAVERVRKWSSDLDLLDQIGGSLEGLPTAA